ncbi:MAG: low-complexity tail membrane protein [Cyanobacteria bacterium J06623_5]
MGIKLQQDRYLWVHLLGLAAVPLLLAVCLAGLASVSPTADYPTVYGGQFWAIALLGIVPPLLMQWLKPFYLFSLPPFALQPRCLSDDQRRCLQLLTSWQIKALSLLSAFLSFWVLSRLYERLSHTASLFSPLSGTVVAAITFLIACLFLQISISAGRIILVGPAALRRVPTYDENQIPQNFLILGLPVEQILPAPPPAEKATRNLSMQERKTPPTKAEKETFVNQGDAERQTEAVAAEKASAAKVDMEETDGVAADTAAATRDEIADQAEADQADIDS